MYRQGDILIVPTDGDKRRIDLSRSDVRSVGTPVVARGEATGHAHQIEGDGELFLWQDTVFLRSHGQTRLVHDEHDTIVIPEGEYRVVRQREYDEGEIRYVSD